MSAMTMPFRVSDLAQLDGLEAGDVVEFVFVVEDGSSHAQDVRVVGHSTPPAAHAPSPSIARLREGSIAPPAKLVDQDGTPISVSDTGRWTVLTFIFTRCPVPEYCPRMGANFHALQDALQASGSSDVRLLSVTMDPEFDSMDILRRYGQALHADFATWEFATGEVCEIERLLAAFRVYVRKDGVTLEHTLCTALIAPNGRIARIWRGNEWTPNDVLEALQTPTSHSDPAT
jgi:protein SCO1/2